MYKIILQNTKTALQHTDIQYIVTTLVIKGNAFHDQYPKENLIFFISFFKLFVMSISSSHSYLLTK